MHHVSSPPPHVISLHSTILGTHTFFYKLLFQLSVEENKENDAQRNLTPRTINRLIVASNWLSIGTVFS